MTIDKKIREIARVCATLSKSAPTAEEHDIFANLTLTWLSIALESSNRAWEWIVGAVFVSVITTRSATC